MPDTLQSMPACTDNQRGFLATLGPVLQASQIIRQDLYGIMQLVQILNFGNRPQAAKCCADPLPYDRAFADARIGYAQFAMFLLKPCKSLIDITNSSNVLTEGQYARIALQSSIEAGLKYFTAIDQRRRVTPYRLDVFNVQGRPFRLTVQMGTEAINIFGRIALDPRYHFVF